MATPWQLVVTSLDGSTPAREASVEAENWLAALRAGRRTLSEDGGVPPGASCTMSAAGDVTIVDGSAGIRYDLRKLGGRSAPPPARPSHAPAQAPAPRPVPAAQPAQKKRSNTVAYTAEEAARMRAELVANAPAAARPATPRAPSPAPQAPAPAPTAAPAPAAAPPPGAAAPRPATPSAPPPPPSTPGAADDEGSVPLARRRAVRQATVAYLHNPLGSQPPSPAAEPAAPPPAMPPPAAPRPATPSPDPGHEKSSPVKNPPAHVRQKTVAYLEGPVAPPPGPAHVEPARAPVAAPSAERFSSPGPPLSRPAPAPRSPSNPPLPAPLRPPAAPAGVPTAPGVPGDPTIPEPSRPAGPEAVQSRAAPQPSASLPPPPGEASAQDDLRDGPVLLHSRDEEPTEERPLVYRERAYVVDPQTDELACEWLLREQLTRLRATMDPSRSGNFVSIALFDHAWTGRPSAPPIATLQWKDWRGEPKIRYSGSTSNAWRAPSQAPPPTSLPPGASAVPREDMPQSNRGSKDSWPRTGAGSVPPPPAQADSTGEHDRRLAYAFEAAQDLYFLDTAGEGMSFVVRLLQDMIPCEAARGALYDINSDQLRVVAHAGSGSAPSQGPGALPANRGLVSIAIASGLSVWVSVDLAGDPRFRPELDALPGLEPRNAAYIVLRNREALLGVVQLLNRTDGRGFSESDKAIAAYAGEQLNSFLRERRVLPARK